MSHRILVIDHHPQGLQRVVDPLQEAGYEVAVARTVADGAAAFGRFQPALVFIAARLPRTHGTVLCRELKRTDAGSSTPIVLIVESTGIQIDLPPLDQFGADRLLQKPVSPDELLAICTELLEGERKLAAADGDEPDDGLSNALKKLDSVEFDLPDEVVRGPRDTPQPPAVLLSDDRGEDIENHIEDLLTEKQSPAPAPTAGPEPSTGRDNDADAVVIDELDLDESLNAKLSSEKEANTPKPAQNSTTRRPTAVPSAPSATTTVNRAVGRYQTEAFTSNRTMPQPFPEAAEARPVAGLARWSWVAIPITVVIVFLAVFFMSRPRETKPDTGFAATPQFGLPADPVEETDPSTAATEPGEDEPLEVAVQQPLTPDSAARNVPSDRESNDPEPRTVAQEPEPVVESMPPDREPNDPEPRTVAQDPKPQIQVIEDNPDPVVKSTTPDSAAQDVPPDPEPNDPEPRAVAQDPESQIQVIEDIPDPVVKSTTPDPEPEPADFNDPAPPEVAQHSITRDPVLIQRVEPRVSKKDLKKGGGTIVLRVRISETGNVTRVLVDQGLPGSPLEAAAVAAVLRWRYEPALDRDEPVEAWTTASFTFD